MDIADEIISGHKLTFDEACALLCDCGVESLCASADKLREHFFKNKLETCSIVNARSGRCPENCKWCAQSAHHKTSAKVYPLMGPEEILKVAKMSEDAGIRRFSVVTSGRALGESETESLAEAYRLMRENTPLGLCGSLGLLNKEQLKRLKDAGMTRYHCNLETAPSMFPKLCTTHTIEDKIRTINWAREVGLEICSGGIIGMGETREQRVEFALALRDIGAMSIPVNILNPIKNTPLEHLERLSDGEILRTFAIFRLVNPAAHIRFAGGRTLIGHLQRKALKSGVSAAIVGDMLTTVGFGVKDDFKMFEEMGYEY